MTQLSAPTGEQLAIEVHLHGGRAWVIPTGELDLVSAKRLERRVTALAATGLAQVVVDLRRLTLIDCAGIKLFLRLDARSRQADWHLSLVEDNDRVGRILALTGAAGLTPFAEAGRSLLDVI